MLSKEIVASKGDGRGRKDGRCDVDGKAMAKVEGVGASIPLRLRIREKSNQRKLDLMSCLQS